MGSFGWFVAGLGFGLLALAVAVAAHDPTPGFPGEMPGYSTYVPGGPGPLDGWDFHGPIGTPVQDAPCRNAALAARFQDSNFHIGHINGVENLRATNQLTSGIAVNSVYYWHFGEYSTTDPPSYENPHSIEGTPAVADSSKSIMLEDDGYFVGKFDEPMVDAPGDEIRITDVHPHSAYCVYGMPDLNDNGLADDGPFLFIDSTYNDGAVNLMDLDLWYNAFYATYYGTADTPHVELVMFIASDFDDPSPPPLSAEAHGPYTSATGVSVLIDGDGILGTPPYTCHWTGPAGVSFGDANLCDTTVTMNIACPTLTANVMLTLSVTDVAVPQNLATDTASFGVSRTCPPTVDFTYNPADTCLNTVVGFNAVGASDPDGGPIASWTWDFGDGSPPVTMTTPATTHQYTADGDYTVTVTVVDNDGESGGYFDVVHAYGEFNCPPTISAPSHLVLLSGASIAFQVSGADVEPDTLVFSVSGLPAGAAFNPATGAFAWTTDVHQIGYFCMTFSVTDGTATASKLTCITVSPEAYDLDKDGIADDQDNCPNDPNVGQADTDRDGIGDACDQQPLDADPDSTPITPPTNEGPDRDRDGVADVQDNCVLVANHNQADLDNDGQGDLCDLDVDGDQVVEAAPQGVTDNCPTTFNPDQKDSDGDGLGDACKAAHLLAAPVQDTECSGCADSGVVVRDSSQSGRYHVYLGLGVAGFLALGGAIVAVVAVRRRLA